MSIKVEDSSIGFLGMTAVPKLEDRTVPESEAGSVSNEACLCEKDQKREAAKSEDSLINVPSTNSSAKVDQLPADAPIRAKVLSSEPNDDATETNIIIKKEEDLDSDENVFEAVIESRFGVSTDTQEDFECDKKSFETAVYEANKIPASEFEPQVGSSSLDLSVQTASYRCKSEKQSSVSSHFKVRDVRVVLVDLFPKNSMALSNEFHFVNHTDSCNCKCLLCTGKLRIPKKTGNVLDDGNVKSQKLGKLKDGQWYLCSSCPAKFIFAHNLKRHSILNHQVYLCLECRVKFECDLDLQTHSKMHSENHLCLFCSFQSKTEAELDVHLKSHRGKKCFSCAECKLDFEEGYDLLIHLSKHGLKIKGNTPNSSDVKLLACTYCPAQFKFPSRLRDHLMIIHTKEGDYLCPSCPKKFVSPGLLKSHLVMHSSKTPYSCGTCHAKFKRPEGLRAHLLVHKTEKPYSCKFCNIKFRSKGPRNRHEKNHTEEKKYQCPFCDRKFKAPSSVKYHIMIHKNELPLSCTYCPAKFRTKRALSLHSANHTGERRYKCYHCGSRSKTKTQLSYHIATHFDARPIVCGLCTAAFKSSREVKKHRLIHSNDKPCKCDFCPAAFRDRARLNVHRKIHLREAVYEWTL